MEENKITSIIKTKNSEESLTRTLESLKKSDEIIVIDENSTDDTTEIAKAYKAKIIYCDKNFENELLNSIAETSSNWVLFLKDNEAIQDKLFNNIINFINSKKAKKISCVDFTLKDYFFNKELKMKSKKILRCARKDFIENFNCISFEPVLKKEKKYHFNKSKGAIYKYHKIDIEQNIIDLLNENKEIIKQKKNKKASVFIKPLFCFLYWYFIKMAIFEGKTGYNFAILKAIKKYLLELMYLEKNIKEEKNDF